MGLQQVDVARRSGLSAPAIFTLDAQRKGDIYAATVFRYAHALEVERSQFSDLRMRLIEKELQARDDRSIQRDKRKATAHDEMEVQRVRNAEIAQQFVDEIRVAMRAMREEAKLSTENVGKSMGVKQSSISAHESGKYFPMFSTLMNLGTHMGVPLEGVFAIPWAMQQKLTPLGPLKQLAEVGASQIAGPVRHASRVALLSPAFHAAVMAMACGASPENELTMKRFVVDRGSFFINGRPATGEPLTVEELCLATVALLDDSGYAVDGKAADRAADYIEGHLDSLKTRHSAVTPRHIPLLGRTATWMSLL